MSAPPIFRGPHSAETRAQMSASQKDRAKTRRPPTFSPEVMARIVAGVVAYSRTRVTCPLCGAEVGQRVLAQHQRGRRCADRRTG